MTNIQAEVYKSAFKDILCDAPPKLTRKIRYGRREVSQQESRPTLQQMRLKRAMSATELGRKAHVSTSTITYIEGGAPPRMGTIRKLAEALHCEPQDIDWPGDPFAGLQ
jgi:DNA-binding Xre family transcriptional regulator